MSNVTLSIGGRSFAVACADGEEAHVGTLGRLIDEKVSNAGVAGQTEARMLLFASLLLADEVHELKSRPATAGLPAGLEERLAQIAGRIENLADLLEAEPASA
jgi:cell division protein ZapA